MPDPQDIDAGWSLQPDQQAAHANRNAAANVPPQAAVNAITKGGPLGIPPSVGMTQPQYVDQVANQQGWSMGVQRPPVARFAATSPAYAAAAAGSVDQLSHTADTAQQSYFSDVAERWHAGHVQQEQAWGEIGSAAFNPQNTFFNVGGLIHIPLTYAGDTTHIGQAIGVALGGWHLLGGAWNSLVSPATGGVDTLQRNAGLANQQWASIPIPGTDRTLDIGLKPHSLGDIASGLAGIFAGGRGARGPREMPSPGEPPRGGPSVGPGPTAPEAMARQPFHTGQAWNTSPEGFLANEAGQPVGFASAREAASWRMQNGGDQVFEPDLHPEGIGLRDVQARPADPYWEARASRQPVPGVDPQTDEVLAANADSDAVTSERIEKAVSETPLHSQSPELMEEFLGHNPAIAERDVQVDPFALKELYNQGHTPFQDNIEDIEDAMFRGTSMTVPYAKWLAEVSGKPYAEAIRSATAFTENGISQNEAAEVKDMHVSQGDTSASLTGTPLDQLPKLGAEDEAAHKEITPSATDVRQNPIARGEISRAARFQFTGREGVPELKEAAKEAQANAAEQTVKFSDIKSPQKGIDIGRATEREPTDEEGLHGTLEKYRGEYFVRDGNHRIAKALAAGETEGKFSVIDYDKAFGYEGKPAYEPPKDIPSEYHEPLKSIATAVEGNIDQIFQEQSLGKVFESPKAAGMTPAQFDRYSNALDEAKYNLRERIMQRLYNQIKRERTPDWKAAVELAKEEAIKQLGEHPNIVAYRNLKDPLFKLNPELVKELAPELADQFPKGLMKKDGTSPDDMAELLGYPSGKEMIKEIVLLQRAMDAVGAKTIDAFVKQSANVMAQMRARELAGFDGSPEGIQKEVDQAATGPEMEDFLIRELKAIHDQAPDQPLDLNQIKDKAATIFGDMKTREASSIKLAEKAVQKTGRATEFALEKGNWVAAFKAKQQQLLNHYILRMTHEFVAERNKFERLAKNYARSTSKTGIPQEMMNRIHSFLQDYGYKVPQTQLRYDYNQWAEEQRAAGEPVQPYQAAPPQDISELKVNDFRDTADRLENLIHLAKEAGLIKVLDEHLSMELLTREALEAAEPVRKKPVLADATTTEGQVTPGKINSWMYSPQTMIDILDNRNPNGVFNRVLMQGARHAAAVEHDIIGPEDKAISDILKDMGSDRWNRLQRYVPKGHGLMRPDRPGLETNLTYKDLIGIMLHMGNREGRWHLEEGGWGWNRQTYEDLVLREADPEDWKLVDRIHKSLDGMWPMIAENEKEMGGLVPEKVPALPIILHRDMGLDAKGQRQINIEVHDGGYFPLRRDDRLSSALKGKPKVDPGSLWAHFLQEGATPKGHTIRRVQASYVPSLDWTNTILSHIPNVAKRIAYGKWALDALKFISQPEMVKLIEDVHGPYAWNALRGWLQRQLGYRSIDPRAAAGLDGMLKELRLRTYGVQTGFKLSVMLEHGTSIAQTAAQAGFGTTARGYVRWLSNPAQAHRFAVESSDYMRIRSDAVDREMRDIIDDINNNRSTLLPPLPFVGRVHIPLADPSAVAFREFSQRLFAWVNHHFAAVPAYIGAYHDAMEGRAIPAGKLKPLPPMTHEEAVAYAEKVVSKSHGSGMEMDMGTFQSGGDNELLKTINMFNVFRGTFGSLLREGAYHAFQGVDTEERLAGWKQFLIAAVGITTIANIAIDQWPHKDKNGNPNWTLWMIDNMLNSIAHMVPMGANLYQTGSRVVTGKPPQFEASPMEGTVTSGLQSLTDLSNAAQHRKVSDPKSIENASILIGLLLHLPGAGQAGEGFQAVHDILHPPHAGRVTRPVQAILFGPSHERERKDK
jgi:hypothetical protein